MLRVAHVRKTVSYLLLVKGIIGGGFTVLTLLGVTLPFFGHDITVHQELGAAGFGGIIGAIIAFKA